jgi:HK97 family phage prohead protease
LRGQFHSTPKAQLLRKVIRERLERGKDVAMSIGYQITDDEFDEQKSVRMLKEIELFEVSVVSVPANPLARLASVKQIEAERETEEAIEARRIHMRRLFLTHLAGRE